MRTPLSRNERVLAGAAALLALAALFGPAIAQPLNYHAFADDRALWAIPFAQDVLSNLAFLAAGLWGFAGIAGAKSAMPRLASAERALAALFFTGLLCAAAGSAWYHLAPDDARLAIDRMGMSVAFAGLLGLATMGRISARAGAVLAAGVLVLAPVSIGYWHASGNLLPWALLQGGGMACLLWFASLPGRAGTLRIRWGAVIALYAAAKLLELQDHAIHGLTGHLVSGHTLKHVAAALAAWPVIAAIRSRNDRALPRVVRGIRAACR